MALILFILEKCLLPLELHLFILRAQLYIQSYSHPRGEHLQVTAPTNSILLPTCGLSLPAPVPLPCLGPLWASCELLRSFWA